MAGARIELSVDLGDAQSALQRSVQSLGDDGTALLLSDVGRYLLNSTRARAALQVAPDGEPWAALSPRYAKYKAKKRPGVPKLKFDFHMLGDQFTWQLDGPSALLVGTNAPYGAIHQFGGAVTVRDPETGKSFEAEIPARPWLGVSQDDEQMIVQLALRHLQKPFTGIAP